ncbi:MAG: hypothetical protein FJ011_14625 [Chloroflexi bacterium]|nr:hypothetical protein [Chloroflexota bacterium]
MALGSWSERYTLTAAIALLLLVLLDNAELMLTVSALGLVCGLIIAWKSDLKRAGVVALAAFAVAGALALWRLLRG